MKKVNIVTHRTVDGLQGLNTAYFSDKSRMTLANVLSSIRISKLTVKPSRYRQILYTSIFTIDQFYFLNVKREI